MQSTFSKRNTFGARTECPSYKQSNKGIRERKGPTVDVLLIENSVKRVDCAKDRRKATSLEKSWHGNEKIISRIMRTALGDQSLILSVFIEGEQRRLWLKRVKPLRSPKNDTMYSTFPTSRSTCNLIALTKWSDLTFSWYGQFSLSPGKVLLLQEPR